MSLYKLIIFDLDGTLYNFDNSDSVNFTSSKFYETIKNRAYDFLSKRFNLSIDDAKRVYEEIKTDFNGEVSLGLESRFKIDRYEWFQETWNLEPDKFIEPKDLDPLFKLLDSEIAILTAAPRVWASRVLDYLNLSEYQTRLFTGEPDLRKPNPLAFQQICDQLGIYPRLSVSVGDQVSSDILPAKALGMKTVLVRDYSKDADFCIGSLEELPAIIRRIFI